MKLSNLRGKIKTANLTALINSSLICFCARSFASLISDCLASELLSGILFMLVLLVESFTLDIFIVLALAIPISLLKLDFVFVRINPLIKNITTQSGNRI